MKRIAVCFLCLCMVLPSAVAEVLLAETKTEESSYIAALEAGAMDAYFSPYDESIYYLFADGNRFSVSVYKAGSDFTEAAILPEGANYSAIRADRDGNIYLLRQNTDPSMKSSIVRLSAEDNYYSMEYTFSAASEELIPYSMEFSPFSSSGCIFFWLNQSGEYVPAASVFNHFWGTLEGYDELIAIEPGSLTAEVFPMIEMYDSYGYVSDGIQNFLSRVSQGELLTPTDAAFSPDGEKLLLTVPYQSKTLLYVMDVFTLELELLYPPDNFSGTVQWTDEGSVEGMLSSGETVDMAFGGFNKNAWADAWSLGWEESSWGETDNAITEWGVETENELSDWS